MAKIRFLDQVPIGVFQTPTSTTNGSFSGSFTGSLFGTSSWSIYALTASYFSGSITNAISASYALTASFALNAGGGGANISGTQYFVPLFNSTSSLITSSIFQSGSYTSIRNNTTPYNPTNPDILFVDGEGVNTYNLISAHSDLNNYVQINIQNFNPGATASSDIVATADIGNEDDHYIDMGINGSGYNDPNGVGLALDAYLYSTGQDLLIGNATDGNKVIIFNGDGPALDNARVYIDSIGTVGINASDPTVGNPEALLVEAINNTTYNLIRAKGNVDNFLQLGINNRNTGSSASSDIVAYNDLDPNSSAFGFIDMGINSSNFNDPVNYPGWTPGDGYLYTDSSLLRIGSSNTGNSTINFFIGANPTSGSRFKINSTNQHQMTGSLDVSGSIKAFSFTGSLLGTASYATNALSASFTTTASYILNAVSASYASSSTSASFASTASYVLQAVSASFASTASYVLNAISSSYASSSTSASYALSSSYALSASFAPTNTTGSFTGSFTGSLLGTASWANNVISSSYARTASIATSASYALTASYVLQAVSSSFASTASIATSSSYASSSTSASYALTASYVANASSFPYTGSAVITGSLIVTGSISSTLGFTGSLLGTASYATNALSASYFSGSVSNAISASYAATSSIATSASYAFNSTSASFASTASIATSASYALNGGVTQLLAGPNITLSPTNGLGQVTITAALSGSTSFNTATGSYGSFYDTTTQTNPVANVPRSMSFNTTDITNGVSISGSTSPYDTYIKIENPGVYDIQFSAQLDKTDAGKDEIIIWLRKNGIDLTDTATSVSLTNNNDKVVAAWNWFVTSAANDYYQIIWLSADTNIRLLAEPISGTHPGIPSVIVTANRVDQFLSNTGSFSGSFNGNFTGSLLGTASYATNALSSSFALTSSLPLLGVITASATNTTITFTRGNGTTFDVTVSQSGSVATASYALFAEQALSSSYAGTASVLLGSVISSSYAATASIATSASYALSASFAPTNTTGSFTGSFTGSLLGTASWAQSSSQATSASYALSSSYALSASFAPTNTTGSFTGSFTGSLLGTASYSNNALSASFASTASLAPNYTTLTSFNSFTGSYRSGSFTGSFTGSLLGTASWANNVISASYAGTASVLLGSVISASYAATSSIATSSSYALTASFALNGGGGSSNTKAGSGSVASFTGTPLISAITFVAAFADNNYSVTVTGEDARIFTIQSKSNTGFTINTNSNTALTGPVYWIANPFA